MSMYEDDSSKAYNEISQSGKSHPARERGGLIPITAAILNQAEVTKEDTVEYEGIPIIDITAVGYIIDYKELESRVKITIFDYTGIIEINFFNNNSDSSGINKLNYDGTRKPVQIFGNVKVYKNEKNIQGGKILEVKCSEILYHRTDVIHAWLYLTGKLQELKENQIQNSTEEAKKLATANNNFNNQRNTPVKLTNEQRELKDAIALLENYNKRQNKNEIGKNEIKNLFKKFGNNKESIINKLIDENKLIDNDTNYEIML